VYWAAGEPHESGTEGRNALHRCPEQQSGPPLGTDGARASPDPAASIRGSLVRWKQGRFDPHCHGTDVQSCPASFLVKRAGGIWCRRSASATPGVSSTLNGPNAPGVLRSRRSASLRHGRCVHRTRGKRLTQLRRRQGARRRALRTSTAHSAGSYSVGFTSAGWTDLVCPAQPAWLLRREPRSEDVGRAFVAAGYQVVARRGA